MAEASFHLHLISDSTGETLLTVARAVLAQYEEVRSVEHVYPRIRTHAQLEEVIGEIKKNPGIVLFTLLKAPCKEMLEKVCAELGVPAVDVLAPVFRSFQQFLRIEGSHRVGGQHSLDSAYFKRIEALNYTLLHDDGQMMEDLEEADVVLVGISRTSKTPTSIYMANRGIKTANIPLVPDLPLSEGLVTLKKPLIVGLVASVGRIVQIRQNRLLSLKVSEQDHGYVDRQFVAREIAYMRRLCARYEWPIIDVTRRSIEETAVEILTLYRARQESAR